MSGRIVAGLLLLAVAGAGVWSLGPGGGADHGDSPRPPSEDAAEGPPVLAGPRTCLPCHADVVDEWNDSMHAAAFTDPQVRAPEQADDFRKTECLPCHAPRPLFEHGINEGERVLARLARRADGVDCLSCHGLPDGVAASRPGLSGACRPVHRPELSTHMACAACHDQHNTHQEWLASPAHAAGVDCIDCHMPEVARTAGEAGGPRPGRSHRFLGGRDRDFALDGLRLEHERRDGQLHVTLTNTFAGHNLPTDSRNRALDLVVTLYDEAGRPLPGADADTRPSWARDGTARRRFRNPYRSSGRTSTQLPAGESATLSVPLPDDAARATVELFYKLQPFVPDREAHWNHRREVALR